MSSDDRPTTRTSARPVPLRRRPELIVQPQLFGRRRYWVVKDPASLEYHQLGDEEYAVLQMLDGQTSLEEIQRNFEATFAPQRLSLSRLQALLGLMHRQGLLIADTQGQGEQLLARRGRKRRWKMLTSLGNVLAVRLPGVAPGPFLNAAYPWVRWLFSPWCVACCLLLVLAAVTLVAVEYRAVVARLPDLQAFFNARNLVLLAITLATIKILHELGHAFTCRHFGGECREIGMMFLVFTPCLYCNVTDSWMIAGKWRRIAISGAGIYVEVVLAAVCTFLWWNSLPGVVHSLCLNVMFICSVNTVFLNGNPLLRYDGYFVLSDWLELPNLWQRSRSLIYGFLRRVCLGIDLESDRAIPRRGRTWLLLYGLASTVYRALVVVVILYFVYKLLKLYGMQSLAVMLALVVIAGLALMPMIRITQLVQDPSVRRRLRWRRLIVAGGLFLSVVAALLLIPMPHRVSVPVFVDACDAERVYVVEAGTLRSTIPPGTRVETGHTLAVLEAPALRREIERLKGEILGVEIRLDGLETLRTMDPAVADEMASHIPATEELLHDKQAQLTQRLDDESRLQLTSPCGGFVLAPRDVAPETDDDRLPTWTGTPLEEKNLGCHLEEGTLFCLIGDQCRREAVAYVPQADVEFVRTGQSVRIMFHQLAGQTLPGTIRELAKVDAAVVPPEIAGELDLPVREDETGALRPVGALYEVRISIRDDDVNLVLGSLGNAKITVSRMSWGRRLWRTLSQTFAFQL